MLKNPASQLLNKLKSEGEYAGKGSANLKFKYMKLLEGETIVRLIHQPDSELIKRYMFHWVDGKKAVCNKTFGEDIECPICKANYDETYSYESKNTLNTNWKIYVEFVSSTNPTYKISKGQIGLLDLNKTSLNALVEVCQIDGIGDYLDNNESVLIKFSLYGKGIDMVIKGELVEETVENPHKSKENQEEFEKWVSELPILDELEVSMDVDKLTTEQLKSQAEVVKLIAKKQSAYVQENVTIRPEQIFKPASKVPTVPTVPTVTQEEVDSPPFDVEEPKTIESFNFDPLADFSFNVGIEDKK